MDQREPRLKGLLWPPADFDGDDDVDDNDVSVFAACAGGAAVPLSSGCQDKDLDNDGDGDMNDFGFVQRCYRGADNPVDPDCAY